MSVRYALVRWLLGADAVILTEIQRTQRMIQKMAEDATVTATQASADLDAAVLAITDSVTLVAGALDDLAGKLLNSSGAIDPGTIETTALKLQALSASLRATVTKDDASFVPSVAEPPAPPAGADTGSADGANPT